jgi:hypothetical protein
MNEYHIDSGPNDMGNEASNENGCNNGNNGGCQQICNYDHDTSTTCSCRKGYELLSNGLNCLGKYIRTLALMAIELIYTIGISDISYIVRTRECINHNRFSVFAVKKTIEESGLGVL